MTDPATLEYWAKVRAEFLNAAQPEAEPPVGPAVEEIAGMGMAEFGEARGQLGIKSADSDFVLLGDDQSGLPSWQHPIHVEPDPTPMSEHAEARAAAGIKTASAVFGCEPVTPRTHPTPYTI